MEIKNLSVFFPCVNEEGNIENTVKQAVEVLRKLKLNYEVIVIDDGSIDKTPQIIDRLAKENPNIRAIHHQKNLGYGEALKTGFYNAKYDTIVYTDGDGQFDFGEVTKFIDKLDEGDLIIGYRMKRQDPIHRILFAKGWVLSLFTFFGLRLKDVDCGFKMIKKKVLDTIPRLESQRGAMINAELAIKTRKYGFRVAQVGVQHYPRKMGKPTGANIRVIIKSYIDLVRLWWKLKDEKPLFLLMMGVFLLAVFLRFYRLSDYMTFLGDEGRDAIIVKEMITTHHLRFLGPPMSVGNIYLGPLYYYLMAVAMGIFAINPVAAAGMDALIGVLTVVLIYYLGKVWFNRESGLVAAFLYAISPVTIIYSRSSWNPNPTPFFALLAILGLHKMHQKGNFNWLILVGAALSAAMQMHYLAMLLIPVAGVLWIYEIGDRIVSKKPSKNLVVGTFSGIVSFILVMLPFLLFEFKNGLPNLRAMVKILTNTDTIQTQTVSAFEKIYSFYSYNLINRYMAGQNNLVSVILAILVLIPLVVLIVGLVKKRVNWPILTLIVWLFVGLVGISLYPQNIYDHYLMSFNPAPFLLFGSLIYLMEKFKPEFKNYYRLGMIVLLVILAWANWQHNPLNYPPNKQLARTQQVAEFVIQSSSNQPFNFALLAKNNYDAAYRFYLDQYGHKSWDLPVDVATQLFVVCEDAICNPINNPKYEIAAFGWAKIDSEVNFAGVKIYRLVHNPSGKP